MKRMKRNDEGNLQLIKTVKRQGFEDLGNFVREEREKGLFSEGAKVKRSYLKT